ncbi:MAG: sugar kinase [Actinobacteria bacterium]|nr:sugar kinase [Actinomycetota bacterium]
MNEIWTIGEMLVEIMRPKPDVDFHKTGEFLGPFPSGAPAIFIDTVARLRHSAAIIGGVGQDGFGRCLLDRLISDGVDCGYVQSFPNRSTAVAFVTYFKDGSRKFIYHINNTPAAMVEVPDVRNIFNPRFFHIMGCSLMINEKFRSSILETAKIFIEKGAKVTFDPNIRVELLGDGNIYEIVEPIMKNCSILFPGIEELKLLTKEDEIEDGIGRLFENDSMEVVVLKRGKNGCSVYTRDDRFDIAAYSVKEVDPTGAGDCFDAGFLCGLLEGGSLVESGKMAAAAGALNAAAFGPMEGKITPNSIRELVNAN